VERAAAVLPDRVEGYGLLLRRWRVEDAELLARAVDESADHLRPWMAWMAHHPMPLREREAMLRQWEREWSEGGDVALAIFAGDDLVGSCGLLRRRGPNVLEIGYWIHPRFTRRGLATTAARLLTDTAFSLPGIERVEIHHDKANTASAGVPERLGFRFVGEEPEDTDAPAEIGIAWTWRVDRSDWTASSPVARPAPVRSRPAPGPRPH
jgi:ribosomal-protein-serine acetyltransferase